MHNLIRTTAAKLNAAIDTEASKVMEEIRAELADFVAKLKCEADIALTKAREVFEEVAGRGFPDHDFTAQSAKLREAENAVSKADELGAAIANVVEPALVAPVESVPAESVEPVGEPVVAAAVEPVELAPAAPVEPAAPELIIETKTYEDGTVATGVAPLPEQSPVEPTPQ